MRRVPAASLALALTFLAGCSGIPGRARTPSGAPSPAGVLVKASGGRCASVLAGVATRRVCGRGAAKETPPPDSAAAPADTADASTR